MSSDDSAKCSKLQRSQFFASTRNSDKEKDRSKESTFVQSAQSLDLDCDLIAATKDSSTLLKNPLAKSLSSRYLQSRFTNKRDFGQLLSHLAHSRIVDLPPTPIKGTSVSYYRISSISNYRLTNYTNKGDFGQP